MKRPSFRPKMHRKSPERVVTSCSNAKDASASHGPKRKTHLLALLARHLGTTASHGRFLGPGRVRHFDPQILPQSHLNFSAIVFPFSGRARHSVRAGCLLLFSNFRISAFRFALFYHTFLHVHRALADQARILTNAETVSANTREHFFCTNLLTPFRARSPLRLDRGEGQGEVSKLFLISAFQFSVFRFAFLYHTFLEKDFALAERPRLMPTAVIERTDQYRQ
jgi:hypothetical protein